MDLSDRMKEYESAEAGRRFMRRLPVLVRIDGKRFSKFTKDLEKPFDERFAECMIGTTKQLVREFKPVLAYTQSDEITLLFYEDGPDSQIAFDGRISKMVSVLAAFTSVQFNGWLGTTLPDKTEDEPIFDCRAWQVPSKEEAANVFLWREMDAARNSIQMAAYAAFGHSKTNNKNTKEMQEMLFNEKGINWNDYPDHFKRGTFVRRYTVERELSAEELADIPAEHRPKPGAKVLRTEIRSFTLPQLRKILNRTAVIFDGVDPDRLLEEEVAPSPSVCEGSTEAVEDLKKQSFVEKYGPMG